MAKMSDRRKELRPREFFADAITDRAASIVVTHNHPSGDLSVSQNDIDVTFRLREAGNILGISLREHLLLTKDSFRLIT